MHIPEAVQQKFNELCDESVYPEDQYEELVFQALEVDDDFEAAVYAKCCAFDDVTFNQIARQLITTWNKAS